MSALTKENIEDHKSDTPETDFWAKRHERGPDFGFEILCLHARTLEKERNQLRNAAIELNLACHCCSQALANIENSKDFLRLIEASLKIEKLLYLEGGK